MTRIPIIFLAILFIPFLSVAQKKEQREGLLWRISGNGIAAPSYLFGTIHLTDKRVFNFGDSLYAAIERSEGYAMELNPDSLMIEYFNEEADEHAVLLKNAISSNDFNRIKKKLQEQFKKSPDKVTVKEFKDYFNDWLTQLNENGSMQAIMDAYFYNVARRQGKWVGGIEDVADQLSLRDDNTTVDKYYIQDFLDDNRAGKQYLEEMIRAYMEENIAQIGKMSASDDDYGKDGSMLRRNRKMARRIDSLSHIRSTFFAIGSAHLPGDSGVISFLRIRGFIVEPVLSSKKVHASDYKYSVKQIPWKTIPSNTGLYSIEMPGEPQKDTLGYENMDMKMYADISTNLFYLSMGVTGKEWKSEDSLMKVMVKNINKRTTITGSSSITFNGISGKEFIATAGKITYRMQIFANSPNICFTLVGSPTKEGVYSEDANRFFKSLTIKKDVPAKTIGWQQYNNTTYGFSVLFYGKPVEKVQPAEADKTSITTVWSSIDLQGGVYYQLMVQDLRRGYYLTHDTSVFASYRDNIAANEKCRLIQYKLDKVLNYPAMWAEFAMANGKDSFYSKVLNLHHGNRIFYLVITAEDAVKSRRAIDSFFNSFYFIPPKEVTWSLKTASDNTFKTWAPGNIEVYVDTTEVPDENEKIFDIYDPAAPVTFYVRKARYSKFFWADSDTGLLRREAEVNIGIGDSLLEYKPVTNGKYKGVELLIQLPDNHNVKKIRTLLVGDTLYNIYGVTTKAYLRKDNPSRFFNDFQVNQPDEATTLFQDKSKQLFEALNSKDSATFEEAKIVLRVVKFNNTQLPLLHEKMLEWYADSATYNSVNKELFKIVGSFRDARTIDFIKQVYGQLPAEKEKMRYDLLHLLAQYKTAETMALLKELLLKRPPSAGVSAYLLYSQLDNSLALVAPVFPGLLPLVRDSVNRWRIISLAEKLLDSNFLDIKILAAYREDLHNIANASLSRLHADPEMDDWYWCHSLIRVLGKFGQPEDYRLIRQFLVPKNKYLAYTVVTALIKHNQPVEATTILQLAADNYHRVELYRFLEEVKKESLFPKKYLTQQAFAEAELYNYANEDDYVKKITLLGERTITYKKEKKKFYLFKVDVSYEDETRIYLGVAGPYALKFNKPETGGAATGIHWSKDFDAKTIDTDFKAFLEERDE